MLYSESLFEVQGVALNQLVVVISGTFNPHLVGKEAPIGSMFLQSNGDTWKKYGPTLFDWRLEAGGTIPTPTLLRTVTVTEDYLVEVDVKTVCANHYYEEGIVITLDASNYYEAPITIKNLSGNIIFIVSQFGRIEGKKGFSFSNKYSSVILEPYGASWIITAEKEGIPFRPSSLCKGKEEKPCASTFNKP